MEDKKNFEAISAAFNSTSRFGRLKTLTAATAGRNVYIRFKAQTGDAMGMNMWVLLPPLLSRVGYTCCG